jgi:peptidyl-Lys metalloendopeptidase
MKKVLFVACILFVSKVVAKCSIDVSLSPEKDARPWVINMKVTNDGETPVAVLKWNTPFDTMQSNMFDVRDEAGRRAEYIGHIAKRGPPTVDDFLTLGISKQEPSDRSEAVTVDLSELYRMPHANTTYTVTFVGVIFATDKSLDDLERPPQLDVGISYHHIPVEALEMADVDTSSLSFWLFTSLLRSPPQAPLRAGLGAISYSSNCDTGKQSTLVSVVSTAKSMASQCASYLTASSCDAAFVKWFGRYTGTSRWSAITQNFNRINAKISSNVFGLNCMGPQCSPGTFAYVYPTDSSFTVYLCGGFWDAFSQYDSKPGTIIHEMSHFSVIAGTQDHTYGTSGAQDYASRQPDKAINNADNHEYFAESSPRC